MLGFSLGLGLIFGWIFLRVRPARPDLIIIVEDRPWRRRVFLRYRIDHKPAPARELPDVRLGRVGLA